MKREPTAAELDSAATDVECSVLANCGSDGDYGHCRSTAQLSAVDWLNERGLDNSYADTIATRVMVSMGFR